MIMKATPPIMRGEHYYIRRKVPARFAPVEPRKIIQLCLFTDSPKIAAKKAGEVWSELVEGWECKLEGNDAEADARFESAMKLAQRRGYRFHQVEQVAKLPIAELGKRLDAVKGKTGKIDKLEAEALVGLAPVPKLNVRQAFDEFYKVGADKIIGKSEDQIRRHKAPRKKATNNFIAAVGNKALAEVSQEDMFTFRSWLIQKVAAKEIQAASVNKDLTYLKAMWATVARAKQIKLNYGNEGLTITDTTKKKNTRPPFSDSWIKTKLLAKGALDGLNTEARLILLGMVNTGYRPSEGAGLIADTIRLDTDVPHIIIRPEDHRTLKNANSERIIPLTGISLEAFKEAKNGFPRYASNNASLSATVNKFLRENGLLENDETSMYSLRHSFEDRLLVAGIDERIRCDLMGHGLKRERYGRGGDLDHIHKLLIPIAL
jgi:integrase